MYLPIVVQNDYVYNFIHGLNMFTRTKEGSFVAGEFILSTVLIPGEINSIPLHMIDKVKLNMGLGVLSSIASFILSLDQEPWFEFTRLTKVSTTSNSLTGNTPVFITMSSIVFDALLHLGMITTLRLFTRFYKYDQ